MDEKFLEDIGLSSADMDFIIRLYRLKKNSEVYDVRCLDKKHFQKYLIRTLDRLLLTDARKLFNGFSELIEGEIVNYPYYQHCFQFGLENGKDHSVIVSSMNDWVKFEYDAEQESLFRRKLSIA